MRCHWCNGSIDNPLSHVCTRAHAAGFHEAATQALDELAAILNGTMLHPEEPIFDALTVATALVAREKKGEAAGRRAGWEEACDAIAPLVVAEPALTEMIDALAAQGPPE